jgi:hypothetical protein
LPFVKLKAAVGGGGDAKDAKNEQNAAIQARGVFTELPRPGQDDPVEFAASRGASSSVESVRAAFEYLARTMGTYLKNIDSLQATVDRTAPKRAAVEESDSHKMLRKRADESNEEFDERVAKR